MQNEGNFKVCVSKTFCTKLKALGKGMHITPPPPTTTFHTRFLTKIIFRREMTSFSRFNQTLKNKIMCNVMRYCHILRDLLVLGACVGNDCHLTPRQAY